MLDDIQRQQSTDGNRVTDNEILTLAARIKASPAATRVEANEVPVDVLDERPEDRKSQRAINKQPDSVETNDIQDLEKALQ
jgi:hypothetical protein